MKKWLVAGAILILAYMLMQWSRSDYLEFSERREAWHQRCDAYVGSKPSITNDPATTAQCNRELQELLAYAKRKGWTE